MTMWHPGFNNNLRRGEVHVSGVKYIIFNGDVSEIHIVKGCGIALRDVL